MSEKDAGPGDVRNDDPDRQNRVDGRALEPAVRVAVLEALPPVVTVESAEGED